MPPSSVWQGAAATLSTQCSDTALSTRRNQPPPLGEKHRDTPTDSNITGVMCHCVGFTVWHARAINIIFLRRAWAAVLTI